MGNKESRRADSNRLSLLQLRVIGQALQGFARGCKSPISKRLSSLRVAECCTVLRSRWYQIGIRTSGSYSLTVGPMARLRDLRSHNPNKLYRRYRIIMPKNLVFPALSYTLVYSSRITVYCPLSSLPLPLLLPDLAALYWPSFL